MPVREWDSELDPLLVLTSAWEFLELDSEVLLMTIHSLGLRSGSSPYGVEGLDRGVVKGVARLEQELSGVWDLRAGD